MKIDGVITAISQKENKFGINIKGEWYNMFGQTDLRKGDFVEIEYEKNKFGNQIKTIEGKPAPKERPGNSADENAHYRRILDCVLEASACFRQAVIKREEIAEYASGLYRLMGEIDEKILPTE